MAFGIHCLTMEVVFDAFSQQSVLGCNISINHSRLIKRVNLFCIVITNSVDLCFAADVGRLKICRGEGGLF